MAKTIETVSVGIKLDGKNFAVWSRLMRAAIGSRELLDHLEGDSSPPESTYPKFKEWQAGDYTVYSWLTQNMEPKLVMQFAQHQTAKGMWKSLTTTFGVRADPLQVYDLDTQTSRYTQGNQTLEEYWGNLQHLWVSIEARKPCPYTCCDKGVLIYHKEQETKKLYQFLGGLDERYDGLRRELLKEVPEPTAESAFGAIKREENRMSIWKPREEQPDIGSGFGARSGAPPAQFHQPNRDRGLPPQQPHKGQPSNHSGRSQFQKIDKSKLTCSHCGMTKHTRETCFHLIGFPEGWEDGHKANRSTAKGRMAIGGQEMERENDSPAGNLAVAYAGALNSRQENSLNGGEWWAGRAPLPADEGEQGEQLRKIGRKRQNVKVKGLGLKIQTLHFFMIYNLIPIYAKIPYLHPIIPNTCKISPEKRNLILSPAIIVSPP